MPRPQQSEPSLVRHAGLVALLGGLTPAALAGGSAQWRLQAHVPVMCAILDVQTSADQPTGLAIATSCNAERYRLMLHDPAGQPRLLAARSSAGRTAISGSAVTITSAQPGYAVTTIELAAPTAPGRLTVTLLPG
jgi:hypothetical protein